MLQTLLVFSPAVGALVAGLFGRFMGDRNAQYVTCGLMGVTALCAWINLFGIWTPVDRDQIPITSFAKPAMRKAIASIGDVRAEGSVMTSACEQNIYRFRAEGQLPGAEANGDARIWVCAKDGKPARLEAIDAGSGAKLDVVFDWSRRAQVESPDD